MRKSKMARAASTKPRWTWRRIISIMPLVLLPLFLLYKIVPQTIENSQLKKHGITIKAYVAQRVEPKGHGSVEIKLKYRIKGMEFVNFCYAADWHEGDSVDIVYLPRDPMVIRSASFLK
jgi:hypothetical protein